MSEPQENPEILRQARIEDYLDRIPVEEGARDTIRDNLLSASMCGPRSLVSALSRFVEPEKGGPFTQAIVKDMVEKRRRSLESTDIYETELDNLALILSNTLSELGMPEVDYKFVVPGPYASYAGYQEKIMIEPNILSPEGMRATLEKGLEVVIGVKGIGGEADHIAHITLDEAKESFISRSDFRIPELVDADIKEGRVKHAIVIGKMQELQDLV